MRDPLLPYYFSSSSGFGRFESLKFIVRHFLDEDFLTTLTLKYPRLNWLDEKSIMVLKFKTILIALRS